VRRVAEVAEVAAGGIFAAARPVIFVGQDSDPVETWHNGRIGTLCHKFNEDSTMGLIYVPVTLRESKKSRKKYQAKFLVDSGATDTLAPAKDLKKAGIEPVGKMTYELADGSPVEYSYGLAVIEFMGELTAGRVIFGPDDAEPLLGATALESTGMVVDPRNERLKRLPTVSLK
jgi:clan AA aspartic protease